MNRHQTLILKWLLLTAPTLAAAQTAPELSPPATQTTPSIPLTPNGAGATPTVEEGPLGAFYLDYLEYEQRLHSTSEITEMGEKTKLDAAFKYRFNQNSDLRLRLDIDPYKYPEENKNSKFEVRLHHIYQDLEIQADFDINGDDYGRGATTFGIDDDSKDFFIAYRPVSWMKAIFFPYNFGGEIGNEFRTLDVTRIYYIEGTPAVVNEVPTGDERIRSKTIPGLELQWIPTSSVTIYGGIGSVSFEYPASSDFDIKNQTTANVWKIKEDRAYKTGAKYKAGQTKAVLEYVTHKNAEYTGSLLESAASLQVQQKIGHTTIDLERTHSKAGKRPYRLSKDGSWFANDRGYNPIYVDYFRDEQDWIGKTDAASMVKVGQQFGNLTPFIAYKTMGKNFIFRGRESAEKLRTNDETESHGGLQSWQVGTDIAAGKFVIRPKAEYFTAKNAVYGNRKDLQDYQINNQSYGKKNTVFTLYSTYQF